ncbi:MAG TPA: NYN domain-containing protein [Microvirga sp.]|nr:NYN domain-containing protein [Microvirga sp.]
MSQEARAARLAVLIDADNASAKIAGRLFEEIAKIGEASVRRIYGDFASPRLRAWSDILAQHAIIPQQQFAYTAGKNASDIALVIDAMDLLHTGRFDGFCLVSSDSDFTRLAARIREQGVAVYGFGEHKTPESFRQACRRFIYTENLLLPEARAPDAGPARGVKPLMTPSAAVPILRTALAQMEAEDGWVRLGNLGQRVIAIAPDFDSRTYGYGKLSDLVRNTGAFDVEHPEGGALRVRLKPQSDQQAPAKGRGSRKRGGARKAAQPG